jgi:hypothetical protein
MMMTQVVSLLLLSGLYFLGFLASYSTGAGSCCTSVGGTHVTQNKTIDPVTLGQLGATLTFNGKIFETGTWIVENQKYTVAIESNEVPMKGCLLTFRAITSIPQDIANKDIVIVTPLTNTQNADACDSSERDIVGITHLDATEKSVCSCTFELTSPVNRLDMFVTTVIVNNSTNSIYADQYYTAFTRNLPGPTAPSTRAPVSIPTAPAPSTTAPVPTPTAAAGFVIMSITTTSLILLALTAAVVVL